jgi:hypothetical protein
VSITSPLTLLLAAALASPTLYRTVLGEVDMGDAAIRYLICVPVAAIMLMVLRGLTRDFDRPVTRRGAADRRGAAEADARGAADPRVQPERVEADQP